jgi:hypothetical protein
MTFLKVSILSHFFEILAQKNRFMRFLGSKLRFFAKETCFSNFHDFSQNFDFCPIFLNFWPKKPFNAIFGVKTAFFCRKSMFFEFP